MLTIGEKVSWIMRYLILAMFLFMLSLIAARANQFAPIVHHARAILTQEVFTKPPIEKNELVLTGEIGKDNKQEVLRFDLTLGDSSWQYEIKGGSSTNQGIYQTDVDMMGIKVHKKSLTPEGISFSESIQNKGLFQVYPRRRCIVGGEFFGIPIEGNFRQGMFNDGIFFDVRGYDLNVDKVKSSGRLNYKATATGHYVPSSDCKFGDCSIKPGDASKRWALNFDGIYGFWNKFEVNMKFGDLHIQGRINFTDIEKKSKSIISEDSETTTVTSTRGTSNLTIKRADGKPLKLALPNSSPTEDEKTIRKFLAFLETISFDACNE